MGNPQASSAPVMIGETEYRISPLTDRDIGEINNYLRSQAIRAARQSINVAEEPAMAELTLRIAMQEANKIDWTKDPSLITGQDCIIYVFWLGMRREHPDLTQEEFSRLLLADPDALEGIMDAFMLVQPFLGGSEGNSKAARKPSKKVKKVKKS